MGKLEKKIYAILVSPTGTRDFETVDDGDSRYDEIVETVLDIVNAKSRFKFQ